MSTRDSYILWKDHLAENSMDWDIYKAVEDWDIANVKVARNIVLHVSDAIHVKISKLRTTKEIWELLQTEYGTLGVTVAFLLFKSVLDLHIPSDQHPGKALNQLQMFLIELKDAKFKLPTKIQIMLLLTKLSPNMEVAAQKVAMDGITNSTTFKSIQKLTILSYEQHTTQHGQALQFAHKLSTVKPKPANLSFVFQQQQHAPHKGK